MIDVDKDDDKDKCPCQISNKASYKLICSCCEQTWHTHCLGLKGLGDKSIKALTEWKCPFCYVLPSNARNRYNYDEVQFLKEKVGGIEEKLESVLHLLKPTYSGIVTSNLPQLKNPIQAIPNNPNRNSCEVVHLVSKSLNADETENATSIALKNAEVSFLTKSKKKSGGITIGFPDKEAKENGMKMMQDKLHDIAISENKKILPKLTVMNIPLSVLPVPDESADDDTIRKNEKDVLKSMICDKNEQIRLLIQEGHTLDIVYMNKKKTITLGLKVSPKIRNVIMEKRRLFIGNSGCNVKDRFHILQCYQCQKIGHITTKCPNSDNGPKCMYCAENHMSKDCSHSKNKSNFKCINCSNSSNIDYVNNCNHKSSSEHECPFLLKEIEKIVANTDYGSKNVL